LVDDTAIMISVIEGNLKGLGILYERYKRPLYSYYYRVTCGNCSLSEDMVQQTFERVLRYKSNFKGYGDFSKWLFHMAHHIAIDFSRARKTFVDIEKTSAYMSNDKNQLEILEEKERIEFLNRALAKLDYEDREILILGKIQCLKYKDIAEILNLTEGAVRVRIHRAFKELKSVCLKIENCRL
jgi:RNA polymerase sigma factor (sigma-70 family)